MELILASKSARRQEILKNLHVPYRIFTEDVDETLPPDISPRDAVICLARKKAYACRDAMGGVREGQLLLSADTVVALGNCIYGKPRDEEDAVRMLTSLSGTTHSVFTGYCLISGARECADAEETQVTFRPLREEDIRYYIRTEPPYDKAGAYGIQELAGLFVERISGDYFNIVGLPVSAVADRCRTMTGLSFFDLISQGKADD